jgi:hypothetical protein
VFQLFHAVPLVCSFDLFVFLLDVTYELIKIEFPSSVYVSTIDKIDGQIVFL